MEDVHVGGGGLSNNGDDLQRAVSGRTDEQGGRTVEAAPGEGSGKTASWLTTTCGFLAIQILHSPTVAGNPLGLMVSGTVIIELDANQHRRSTHVDIDWSSTRCHHRGEPIIEGVTRTHWAPNDQNG